MICRVIVLLQDRIQCIEVADQLAGLFPVQSIAAGSLYNVPENDEIWELLRNPCETLILLSEMHPRPAEWLLHERGAGFENLHCLDVREYDGPIAAGTAALDIMQNKYPDTHGVGSFVSIYKNYPDRWYPVIDRSRCVSCGHCVQFCLFGVYSSSDTIAVVQPDSCKPGCPACSRVCPHGAIIFPLYDKDPAISGAPGRIMTPDPAARAMFYKRTGAICPVCTEQAAVNAFAGANCPECGREIPVQADRQTDDELDRLIDEFDKLQFGG